MTSPSRNLFRLQSLDTGLSEQQTRLRELKGLLGESTQLVSARRAHEQAVAELAVWRGRLQGLELDLQGINTRIAATEERLYGGRVTNPKELGALQQDRDYSKRSRDKLEDDALLAMTRLDECETAEAQTSKHKEETEANWRAQQAKLAGDIGQLQDRITGIEKDRAGLAAVVGADELALYEGLLRKKGGRAVALLVDQVCQGCGVALPTNKVQQVRRGIELATCPTCGRILFSSH